VPDRIFLVVNTQAALKMDVLVVYSERLRIQNPAVYMFGKMDIRKRSMC